MRVCLRRETLGISPQRLGSASGLAFRQIRQYERGDQRISASRLFDISRTLETPVSYFFDGLGNTATPTPADDRPGPETVE
ncbi:helix-turn-helix domain-containing protein [Bradyrhizobium sp. USDA 4473]